MSTTTLAPENGIVGLRLASTPNSKVLAKLIGNTDLKWPVSGFLDEEDKTYFTSPLTITATATIADVNGEIVATLKEQSDVPVLPAEWSESLPIVSLNWIENLIVK